MGSIHVYRLQRSVSPSAAVSLIKSHSAGEQVWLVLPWRTLWGKNMLNLRRLAHAANEANIDLRLVSGRSQVRQLARAAGIPPYIALPLTLRHAAQGVNGSTEHLMAGASLAERLKRPRHLGIGAFALALLGTVIVLAAIAATFAVILPSAEITLHPVTRQSTAVFTVTASSLRTEIDYGSAFLPARTVQVIVEDPIQIETGGRIDAADGYASGQVVFANRSEREVVIPKGTYVRTGSGETARFQTVTDAALPAQYNATVRVPIIAMEAGPTNNVRALTINVIEGELASVVEVINDEPTGGGTMQQVPMVTAADQNALYDEAFEQLKAKAYEQLSAELEEGEFIPPESLDTQVMSYEHDQALGERSDVTSMTMKVVTRGTAIQSKELEALATRFIETAAGSDLYLVPGTLQVTRSNQMNVQGSEVTFDVSASGNVSSAIDQEAIKQALRGKELAAAMSWLSANFELAAAPQITVLPPQWERLPVLPARMQVNIEVATP